MDYRLNPFNLNFEVARFGWGYVWQGLGEHSTHGTPDIFSTPEDAAEDAIAHFQILASLSSVSLPAQV